MKKSVSVILALIMVLATFSALSVSTFALENETSDVVYSDHLTVNSKKVMIMTYPIA